MQTQVILKKDMTLFDSDYKENVITDFLKAFNKGANGGSFDYKKDYTNEELCQYYQDGEEYALELLINKNKKLIYKRVNVCGKFYNHDLEIEDLYQFGSMGLFEAAKRYKFDKGAKFSSYATFWIDQRIRRGITDTGFTIRIPANQVESMNKFNRDFKDVLDKGVDINKAKEILIKKYKYTYEEIDNMLYIKDYLMKPGSLDIKVGESEDTGILELLPIEEKNSAYSELEEKLLKEDIDRILSRLEKREEFILRKRFGIGFNKTFTLKELSNELNLSKESVRQIEIKSIRKLKESDIKDILEGYIYSIA